MGVDVGVGVGVGLGLGLGLGLGVCVGLLWRSRAPSSLTPRSYDTGTNPKDSRLGW